ncbi:hypothetical protein TRVA0_022S00716 [Trichomonascus vanleenenianus]|uniref:uncharacterized protein n=1 Tax=Trichomonascus vanleenenianus TaxID=2268995 RepID=UPI003ECA7150
MGKSLRAKTKVRNRCIKRDVVYGPNDKARTERLAAKLGSMPAADKMEADKPEEEDKMEEDKPKVSTSGWKGSRNDDFKKKHKKHQKKKNTLVFKKKSKK